MKKFVLAIVFVALCHFITFAQTPEATPPLAERPFDRYSIEPPGRTKARLDSFVIELQNDPTAQGLITILTEKKTSRTLTNNRTRFTFNYLSNLRGVEAKRLLFAVATGDTEQTELWLVPAGAEMPALPEKHKLIKGENLIKELSPKPKRRTKRKQRRR